jgi:hypothetical protein
LKKKVKSKMSQSGIFNVLDNGLTTGDAGSNNHDALQNLVNSLLSSSGPTTGHGGTILFPSVGTFNIKLGTQYPTGEIDINKGDVPGAAIIFVGSGQQTPGTPNLNKVDAGDLFVVQNNPGHDENAAGVTFQDLMITYGSNVTSGAAIRVTDPPNTPPGGGGSGGQNVRIFRVVFQDCPTSVRFQHSLQCSMLECTAISTSGNGNTQNVVIVGDTLAAEETYIAGCLFRTKNDNQTAIVVNSTEHLRIMNTRIEAFQVGISFKPGGKSYRNHFENVTVREGTSSTTTGAALLIQPQTGGSVAETAFVNCEFAPGDMGGTSYQSGGVYIDATHGTIDSLRFVSCTSVNWPGPGLQIVSGSDLEILGGYYCCNGQLSGTQQVGIYISGPASGVRIVGASCTNSFFSNGAFLPQTQAYGISIPTGAQKIFVHGCDLTGNTTQALTAPASLTNVEVANCAGYNDQRPTLTTTAPGSNVLFNASTYAYYGPVAFYVTGGVGTSVKIDNNSTGLASGGFTLGAGEIAAISYTTAPNFVMVGK